MSDGQHTIVLGCQWGDEGKGKLVDILAADCDVVVRFQGGANAGHTILFDGHKFVLHMLPSGVLRPHLVNVVGNGCVVDPVALASELDELRARGMAPPPGRLLVSGGAHLVTPDLLSEDRDTGAKIGTTGRGIGPTYARKAQRVGIRCEDISEPGFADRIPAVEGKERFLAACQRLVPYVGDCSRYLHEAMAEGKRLLFEGAQGAMLDLDLGSYPFVTSSTTTIGGAFSGAGVYVPFARRLGIAKAYSTRVGNGPFPTELTGETGDLLRTRGHELGSTTGRPRRCGWLDLHLLRKAVVANGINEIALTKLDCLSGLSEILVATGRDRSGQPVYHPLPGWDEELANCPSFDRLPKTTIDYIGFVELHMGVKVRIASVGPDRSKTLFRGAQ